MQKYNEQIEPDAIHAVVPEELHPVAAAFGGDIGAALEKGGNQVASRLESLSSHLARMNYYRDATQRADIVNKYKEALNIQLRGDPGDPNATTTYTPSAETKGLVITEANAPSNTAPLESPIERPLGVYNWTDNMAHGSVDYIDQWHQKAMSQINLEADTLGLRNKATLKSQLDSAWSSERAAIVNHETTQINQAQIKTFMKGMQLDADNAVTKQDPISLGNTINSINYQSDVLNAAQHKEPDDPQNQLTKDKFNLMAINNSTNTLLKTSGDPTQAQSIVDKLHDEGKINDTVYEKAKENIDKRFESITKQNDREVRIQKTNGRMNIVNQAIQGKIDWSNQNSLNDVAQNDPELYTAVNDYVTNGKLASSSPDIEKGDKAFSDATEKMYSAGSKEQIANYLMNVLRENSGKISQDRLNILISNAMDRGKNLADSQEDAVGHNKNPVQSAYDSGMKALFDWNGKQAKKDAQTYADYMTYIKSKISPSDAYNNSITNSIIRNNPSVATMATPPNLVITKDSHIRAVFPRTNRKDNGNGDSGTK